MFTEILIFCSFLLFTVLILLWVVKKDRREFYARFSAARQKNSPSLKRVNIGIEDEISWLKVSDSTAKIDVGSSGIVIIHIQPFRLIVPDSFISWSEIKNIKLVNSLVGSYYTIEFKNISQKLAISKKIGIDLISEWDKYQS